MAGLLEFASGPGGTVAVWVAALIAAVTAGFTAANGRRANRTARDALSLAQQVEKRQRDAQIVRRQMSELNALIELQKAVMSYETAVIELGYPLLSAPRTFDIEAWAKAFHRSRDEFSTSGLALILRAVPGGEGMREALFLLAGHATKRFAVSGTLPELREKHLQHTEELRPILARFNVAFLEEVGDKVGIEDERRAEIMREVANRSSG